MQIDNIDKHFLDFINENVDKLQSLAPAVVNNYRANAIKKFEELGVPKYRSEDYKYTNVDRILQQNFTIQVEKKSYEVNIDDIFKCDVPDLDTHVIVSLNGKLHGDRNGLIDIPGGAIASTLSYAEKNYPELVEAHYNKYAAESKDGLAYLNSALSTDGLFIYVPDGKVIDKPIQIINILYDDVDLLINQRNLIIAGKNSVSEIVVCDHSLSSQHFFTNRVSEVYADVDANFQFMRIQNEHNFCTKVSHTFIQQERGSVVSSNMLSLHGGLTRNNHMVNLDGIGSENNAYGLYVYDKSQHVDNSVNINHNVPNCNSNQIYKGVMDDVSTGSFCGKVYVAKDAQSTNAHQKNNNILLSDAAKLKTRPQLEIYADDVKCSHGATIGQLDEDSMFYLRSRGISKDEALRILLFAFADEILENITIEALRDNTKEMIDKRLRGESSKCDHCAFLCKDEEPGSACS